MSEEREAWVELAAPEAAHPGHDHPYNFGVSLGMSRLIMAHERIGSAFRGAFKEIMFAPGELERREREMVAAVAAAAQDCFYWTQSHAEFLRVEGAPHELVEAIKHGRVDELEGLSDRDRALCRVAEKLSASPTRMIAADWEPLREAGLSDQGCLEVAHVVGIFNHLTRLADGFGLQLDEVVAEASRSGQPLQRPGS